MSFLVKDSYVVCVEAFGMRMSRMVNQRITWIERRCVMRFLLVQFGQFEVLLMTNLYESI